MAKSSQVADACVVAGEERRIECVSCQQLLEWLEKELEDFQPRESFLDRLQRKYGVLPWWFTSGLAHAGLALIFMFI